MPHDAIPRGLVERFVMRQDGVRNQSGGRNDLERPIRVVIFTGGPTLEHGVREMIRRIEKQGEMELVGVISESDATGASAIIRDLLRRRSLLAVPLLVTRGVRSIARALSSPRQTIERHGALRRTSGRTKFVPDINAPRVVELVRGLSADLGLIYGGPIIQPELFGEPRLGTLGIHHGKVPEYRGKKTTFWAIYNGEPVAGVTIQRVSSKLDRGDVVREGEVVIGRRPLWVVWRRLEELGFELFIAAILDIQSGVAEYRPQLGRRGKLYKDPRWRDMLRLWRRYIRRSVFGS